MDPQQTMPESAEVARFYDAVRQSELSAAALAHGDASIGQECTLTPAEIAVFAQRAGITAGTEVLDMGSGTGGPACYLAQRVGCRVVGVDISAVGHIQAEARARAAGLCHLVQFRCDDVHTVALPPASFDVILSLDAWCHIPRRAALLERCATLLRAGGRLALYDHVLRQPLPEAQYRRFCTLWRFADLETPERYVAAVQGAGLRLCAQDVTSTLAVRFYTQLLTQYGARRAEFEAARGPTRYQEGLEWLFHRAMHLRPWCKGMATFQHLAHLRHHGAPDDLPHSVIRLCGSIPLAALIFAVLFALLGALDRALVVHAGIVSGYLIYELLHLQDHAGCKLPVISALAGYHLRHHVEDPHRIFGVTSPLWDWAFGILPRRLEPHR